jgi:thiamine kinase-like enzyme
MTELAALLARLEDVLGEREGPAESLSGGITNRNYRVNLGGRECVLRLPGQDTQLLGIDRVAEQLAAERAASLGIGPEVLYAGTDCVVTAYVGSAAVDPAALRAQPGELAGHLRSFHDSGLALPVTFWIPDLMRIYEGLAGERGETLPDAFRSAQAIVERIARALPLTDPVPCHDDLLIGNLIQAGERIMLVDWEYAGMGHRYFDLGNLAVNNGFDEEAERRLLEGYFGQPVTFGRLATLRLFRIVSDAREGAWGVVQNLISELDFDFTAYAGEHFERLEQAARDPRLEEYLNAATP